MVFVFETKVHAKMKRSIAIAVVLCAFCCASFAVIIFNIDVPQDDIRTRASLGDRPELTPLHAEYNRFVEARLWPLKFSQMEKVFGPKLETATNWWGTGTNDIGSPSLKHRPADLVLPTFAAQGGTNCGGAIMMAVSGLHSTDPAENKSHTDLYAVGDIGYVELYSHLDGEKVQIALIYFRSDSAFIPLKSTNDFPARLEWEKKKFDALKSWFDAHDVPVALPGNEFLH